MTMVKILYYFNTEVLYFFIAKLTYLRDHPLIKKQREKELKNELNRK